MNCQKSALNEEYTMLKNNRKIFTWLEKKFHSAGALQYFNWLPDEVYIKVLYWLRFGKILNLRNPRTFNEKLQWIKLNDRNPNYSTMVDKYEVKKYVAEKIGDKYIIPTLGIWDDVDKIDFESLPDKFVLKCTHDSGGIVICKNKKELDIKATKEKLKRYLKANYFWVNREWPYKYVKPRIIAEEYLEAFDSDGLIEYKFFCFNGKPTLIMISRGTAHEDQRSNDIYDLDFNHIPVRLNFPNSGITEVKPKEYSELLDIAKKLSEGIIQVRVDTYVADGHIFFGELTFFHGGGNCRFNPQSFDLTFGELLKLPKDER